MADRCYLLSSVLSLIFWFAGEEANDCVMDDRCYLLDLFFLWFSFCLCSVVSLPVFARSPYVFLLGSVTVSGAVAAEDGALELLLKTKSRACCRITTVSPFVSLFCSFVPLFFFVRVLWFSPLGSVGLCLFVPPPFFVAFHWLL
jgi:hypothetical protein